MKRKKKKMKNIKTMPHKDFSRFLTSKLRTFIIVSIFKINLLFFIYSFYYFSEIYKNDFFHVLVDQLLTSSR